VFLSLFLRIRKIFIGSSDAKGEVYLFQLLDSVRPQGVGSRSGAQHQLSALVSRRTFESKKDLNLETLNYKAYTRILFDLK